MCNIYSSRLSLYVVSYTHGVRGPKPPQKVKHYGKRNTIKNSWPLCHHPQAQDPLEAIQLFTRRMFSQSDRWSMVGICRA